MSKISRLPAANPRGFNWDSAPPSTPRVSTADQSCERQIAELTAFAERGGFEVLGIFKETASGASNTRFAQNRVLALAQARRIDAVLVTELSRWGTLHAGPSQYALQARRLERSP